MMRETPFLIISLCYVISFCVHSAPPPPSKVSDSEFAKSSDFYAAIVNNAFESKYFDRTMHHSRLGFRKNFKVQINLKTVQ